MAEPAVDREETSSPRELSVKDYAPNDYYYRVKLNGIRPEARLNSKAAQ